MYNEFRTQKMELTLNNFEYLRNDYKPQFY